MHKVGLLRRWLSGCLVLALLFGQFATAAYACPELEVGKPPPAGLVSECERAHAASPMEEEDGLLCKASCEQEAQVVKASVGFDVVQAAVVLYLASAASSRDLVSSSVPPAQPALEGRPTGWPPVYLLHHVLRN